MTGRVYASGAARRYWRRLASRRSNWRTFGWTLLTLAALAIGGGLVVTYLADTIGRAYLGTSLAGAGLPLFGAGLWALLHADSVPEPAARHRPPQRQHLDEALTVWVGRKGRQR